ncbi:M3 family metallopeptidase [Myxococcus sp. K15C18031901]|nr:M3 family metallopeptidase [Myxococcus dinghuensis]
MPHFGHVFSSNAYAAGYSTYLWADVLAADAFEAFRGARRLNDPTVAARLRAHVLSVGNTVDPFEGYRGFRGREATPGALMRERGLQELTAPAPDAPATRRWRARTSLGGPGRRSARCPPPRRWPARPGARRTRAPRSWASSNRRAPGRRAWGPGARAPRAARPRRARAPGARGPGAWRARPARSRPRHHSTSQRGRRGGYPGSRARRASHPASARHPPPTISRWGPRRDRR